VAAATVQQLAADYVTTTGIPVHGRVAQIKILLRHALDDLAKRGDESDAGLIRDLFFGDSVNAVVLSAGDLLENAQRRIGETSEVRFRERRQTAFRAFAGFLLQFVDEARRGQEDRRGQGDRREQEGRHGTALYRQEVVSGYVEHGERFVALLAEANNVTVVGFTNERLTERLEEALQRKRAALARPDAFWSSLRIVYVSTGLLDFLNDERWEYPDRKEAVRLRRLAAVYGRRAVSVFLRRAPSSRWALYETPNVPPFIGSLFEMPSGKRVVQLLIPRPQRSTPDHLFMEMEDLPDQYFSAAFEDIVYNSINDNKVVPIGLPADGGFRCTGRRYRQNVLTDQSGATGWLPLVLVVTYQRRAGRVEPLLQLRTGHNAARELDRISHLPGHIYDGDADPRGGGPAGAPLILDIGHELAEHAAQLRLQMETGDDLPAPLRPVGTWSYLHHDKENMFFFVYALELPEEFQFSRRAEIYRFPLPELFAVRENQALRKAAALLGATGLSARMWNAAAEIVALNLRLHDYEELAQRFGRPRPSGHDLAALAAELAEIEERTRQSWYTGDRDVELLGLSGLQYREFFSMLLPLYADVEITGAAEQLSLVRSDAAKNAAIERLAELYHDDQLMGSLPIEL